MAVRLRRAGFRPVPHVAARSSRASRRSMTISLARAGEAGVEEVL